MKPTLIHRDASRRDFLRGATRYALLTGLSAFVISLAARSRIATSCARRGSCGGCTLLARCDLPPALKLKRER